MNFLIVFYITSFAMLFFHEMCHAAAAFLLGVRIERISVGWEKLSIKVCKIRISPIPTHGYVLIDKKDLLSKGWFAVIFFFESGPAGVLALTAILDLAVHSWISSLALIMASASFVTCNFFPSASTDAGMMVRLLIKK